MINRICQTCGKKFQCHKSQVDRGWGKYCSKKCQGSPRKGMKCSEIHKKRISLSRKGKKHWFFGKHLSKKHRNNISKSMKGKFIGPNSHLWKGEKTKHNSGYIYIYSPNSKNSRMLEHRKIIENYLNRPLSSNEIIHHINDNKSDNRIENLIVFSNRKNHIKFHFKKLINPKSVIFDGRKL